MGCLIIETIITYKNVNYIINTEGKIFSTKNCGRGKYHQELKQRLDGDGYWSVTVGDNQHRTRVRVHRLVALAFLPNPHNLPEVDHKDNNKCNNHVNNLQWITSFDNKSKIPFDVRSKSHQGNKNGRAKFTNEQICEIRKLYESGIYTISALAKKYQAGWSTISHIVKNETWAHV